MPSPLPGDAEKFEGGSIRLQEIVDSVGHYDEFLNLNLSVTIADPLQEDCPLIACSEGFTELTGYSVSEIVGRNCRFLLNGVPKEYIDDETRFKCRNYVSNTKGQPLELSDKNLSEYIRRCDWASSLGKGELICVQTNATKSGELFKNMFYLKQVELNEKPFILGLQARLPEEWETNSDTEELERFCQQAFVRLSKNISSVELVLSKQFWYSAAARRQDGIKTILPGTTGPVLQFGVGFAVLQRNGPLAGLACSRPARGGDLAADSNCAVVGSPEPAQVSSCFESECLDIDFDDSVILGEPTPAKASRSAPPELHMGFDKAAVQSFPHERFELVRKIEDASRNFGTVCLMRDLAQGTSVAMKQMPNAWVQKSHEAFNRAHPHETEQPWNDIGCNAFLDSVGCPYNVKLLGVFRDKEMTSVVTEFADGGDMFSWASDLAEEPGPVREARVKPLAKQIARAIQYLHDLSIVHGDLSIENVLLTSAGDSDAGMQIKVIDFGAAAAGRFQKRHVTGKPSYRAPEIFDEEIEHDGFLADAFSFGVVIYAACLMDYPWISTSGNGDKCFQYVKSKGFAAFVKKRKLPNSRTTLDKVVSLEFPKLLEGLLQIEPANRLTLGERVYGSSRRSVWDLAWTCD